MMKLDYKKQITLSCAMMIVFDVLNTIFKNWIFTSIGFCVCGLLWVIHPVMMNHATPSKWGLLIVRLGGVLLIIIGILTRAYLY